MARCILIKILKTIPGSHQLGCRSLEVKTCGCFFIVIFLLLISNVALIYCCILTQAGRGEALDKITQDVRNTLEQECEEEASKVVSKAVDTVRKQVISNISSLFISVQMFEILSRVMVMRGFFNFVFISHESR